jgi:hypothetical protein
VTESDSTTGLRYCSIDGCGKIFYTTHPRALFYCHNLRQGLVYKTVYKNT